MLNKSKSLQSVAHFKRNILPGVVTCRWQLKVSFWGFILSKDANQLKSPTTDVRPSSTPGGVLWFNLTTMLISYTVAEKSIFENLGFLEFWAIFWSFLLYFSFKIASKRYFCMILTKLNKKKNDMVLNKLQLLIFQIHVLWATNLVNICWLDVAQCWDLH